MDQLKNINNPQASIHKEPMIHKLQIAAVFLGIIILVLLIAIAILVFSNNANFSSDSSGNSVKDSNIEGSTRDDNSEKTTLKGWTSITSHSLWGGIESQYGLAFDYPEGSSVQMGSVSGSRGITVAVESRPTSGESGGVNNVTFVAPQWPAKFDFEDLFESDASEKVIHGGNTYSRLFICRTQCETYYSTIHNELRYIVVVSYGNPSSVEGDEVIEKMLSSVSFVEDRAVQLEVGIKAVRSIDKSHTYPKIPQLAIYLMEKSGEVHIDLRFGKDSPAVKNIIDSVRTTPSSVTYDANDLKWAQKNARLEVDVYDEGVFKKIQDNPNITYVGINSSYDY